MGADEMTDTFFTAHAIAIAYCDNPGCRAVHLHLLDAAGVARAQAVIGCDNAAGVAADIVTVADRIRADALRGMH